MINQMKKYMRMDMWICRMSEKGYIVDCYRIDNPRILKKPVIKLTGSAARRRLALGEFEMLLKDVPDETETEEA